MTAVVSTVIYPVHDLARARTLFVALLGVEPSTDTPYYVGFQVDGQDIGLDPHGHRKGMTAPAAYWHVDDLHATRQALLDAGAAAEDPVRDVGGGKLVATLRDLDGNVIGLVQPGGTGAAADRAGGVDPSLQVIGWVESSLRDPAAAPKQADETAPSAWLVLDPSFRDGMGDIRIGDDLVVVTWLDRARRDVLRVHPQDREELPLRGVFSTRSADRPNPIGLHPVRVTALDADRIQVDRLEAVDRTPVVDIKVAL